MTKNVQRWWLGVVPVAVVLCLVGTAVQSSAQGLAEAARKEEARRKTVKKPAKVYTNGSLAPVPGEVIPTPPPPRPDGSAATAEGGTAPSASGTAPDASGTAPAAAATDPKRTPEDWREKMSAAVQARDNNALVLDALQSRINALWADFTARDNPLERSAIAADRQKALDELERRKQAQVALQKAIVELEDEARRSNVPPGWLR